jgi:hypothetical protein
LTGPQIQPTTNVEATHAVTRCTGTRHRCERQQGDCAQPARREDALGLLGLPRRSPVVGVTPAVPTPRRRAVPPRLRGSTQSSRSPTPRLVPSSAPRSVGPPPPAGCARAHSHWQPGPAHVRRNLMRVATLDPGGCTPWSFLCLSPRPGSPGCSEPLGRAYGGGQRGRRRRRPRAQRGSDQRHPVRVKRRAAGPGHWDSFIQRICNSYTSRF